MGKLKTKRITFHYLIIFSIEYLDDNIKRNFGIVYMSH